MNSNTNPPACSGN